MSNCGLSNVITFDELFNIDSIDMNVYDICGNIIDKSNIQYSYSNDSINWSCYVNYDTFLCNIKDIKSEYSSDQMLNSTDRHPYVCPSKCNLIVPWGISIPSTWSFP